LKKFPWLFNWNGDGQHRNAGDPSSNLGGPIKLLIQEQFIVFPWRQNMASKKLTRFERARLIGARALQISMGARPLVDIEESLDPVDIARKELEKKVIPLDVRRDK